MSEPLRIWILSVCSLLFALILIERHRSQNQGSLKSQERLSDFKERCVQLWYLHRSETFPKKTKLIKRSKNIMLVRRVHGNEGFFLIGEIEKI